MESGSEGKEGEKGRREGGEEKEGEKRREWERRGDHGIPANTTQLW